MTWWFDDCKGNFGLVEDGFRWESDQGNICVLAKDVSRFKTCWCTELRNEKIGFCIGSINIGCVRAVCNEGGVKVK